MPEGGCALNFLLDIRVITDPMFCVSKRVRSLTESPDALEIQKGYIQLLPLANRGPH
jgi:hypothetical protein